MSQVRGWCSSWSASGRCYQTGFIFQLNLQAIISSCIIHVWSVVFQIVHVLSVGVNMFPLIVWVAPSFCSGEFVVYTFLFLLCLLMLFSMPGSRNQTSTSNSSSSNQWSKWLRHQKRDNACFFQFFRSLVSASSTGEMSEADFELTEPSYGWGKRHKILLKKAKQELPKQSLNLCLLSLS